MFQTLHEISKNLIFVFVWKYVWKYVNKKKKKNQLDTCPHICHLNQITLWYCLEVRIKRANTRNFCVEIKRRQVHLLAFILNTGDELTGSTVTVK